jgi:hypothetical protein
VKGFFFDAAPPRVTTRSRIAHATLCFVMTSAGKVLPMIDYYEEASEVDAIGAR